jgi:hypothetical protein
MTFITNFEKIQNARMYLDDRDLIIKLLNCVNKSLQQRNAIFLKDSMLPVNNGKQWAANRSMLTTNISHK